ncbi:Serine/threonine-protein kinase PknD [Planctomycetes bacterium Pan216]|uniref:Serine/threonine-protein kinase PknD n=1 Tax=Kolteria novifilia TaxID=2527975 RepID=A0A518B0K5_9BACT|nr:Serine/threonine-protein kinase PknD [Planctomycetes bacterium Pan216]
MATNETDETDETDDQDPRDDQEFLFGLAVLGRGLIDAAEFKRHFDGRRSDREPLSRQLLAQERLAPEDLAQFEQMLADRLEEAGRKKIQDMIRVAAEELAGEVDDSGVLEIVRRQALWDDTVSTPDASPNPGGSKPAIPSPVTSPPFMDEVLHAEGGLGSVFRARETATGRVVAIKRVRSDRADNPLLVQRFLAEGKVTARLEHPNIVPVYQVSEGHGPPFYVMRFLKGATLQQTIARAHPSHRSDQAWRSERKRLVRLLVRIGEAVAYAHSKNVIHRDLKPANIVLGEFGGVFLLDWGLSRSSGTAGDMSDYDFQPEELDLTQPGQRIGSPLWMAPEQASGQPELIDERTDIYGLGAILFHVLAGVAPHSRMSSRRPDEFYSEVAAGPTPRAREVDESVPLELDAVCAKAMASDPTRRYQSAEELTTDLNRWLAGEPVSVYPEPFVRKFARRAVANPKRSIAAAGILLAVVVAASVVVTSLWANRRSMLDQAIAAMHEQTHAAQVLLKNNVAAIEKDVRYLTTLPGLPAALGGEEKLSRDSAAIVGIGNFIGHWKEYTAAAMMSSRDPSAIVLGFDASGNLTDETSVTKLLPGFARWAEFARKVAGGESGRVYFSRILFDRADRPNEFYAGTPIAIDDETKGVFLLKIELDRRFSDVFGTEFLYESIAMTNEEGEIVFRHRGPSRTIVEETEPEETFNRAREFLSGPAPSTELLTYDVGDEIVMARKLPLRGDGDEPYFGMIITGDRTVILRDATSTTVMLLGVTIGSVVLISLVAFGLGSVIVRMAGQE